MGAEYVGDGPTYNQQQQAQHAVVENLAKELPAAGAAAATLISVHAQGGTSTLPLCRPPGPLDFWYALLDTVDWQDFARNLILLVMVISLLFSLYMLGRWLARCCRDTTDEPGQQLSQAALLAQAAAMRDPSRMLSPRLR
jgi:hypothetical protein